jgi:hypothetical protein
LRSITTPPTIGQFTTVTHLNLSKGEQVPNLIVFGVCFCLLAGALILNPPDPGCALVRLGRTPLPSVCTFKNLTGLPCPGCGLVRSISALVHGRVAVSLACHRLGWLVFLYIAAQFGFRLMWLTIPSKRTRFDRAEKYFRWGLISLSVALILNWTVTLWMLQG